MKADPANESSTLNLRVLHVLHGLHAGGMENGVINLAHGQLQRGIFHDVCALTTSGPFADRLPASSKASPLNKPEGFSFKTCLKLRRLIQTTRPDVVHSHNSSGLIYSAFALALPGIRIPLLAGEHAQLTAGEKAPHRLFIRRWLYRLACKKIHTVSAGQRDELLQLNLAAPEAILSISNGVDTERFHVQSKETKKAAINLPENALVLGMVARLAHHKRHDRLLDAFQQIAPNHPKLHLALVGDRGNAKEAILDAIGAHPFKDRIHWLGMRDDLPEVYPAFDLLVLPSESEGMSNVCLEAMACGVPVAANDSCGATEIIVDGVTGVIRSMPDASAIASHLESCLSDPSVLLTWGQNARRHIERNFSIASMMDRYEKVYRDLLIR
ncbi:glycosyltransferase [Phragmitibacter flavus]|uniref:Glycosyltransferase n=1 Tax=Phragmitibacter flavus TaxID=2576071 RepID=A0A5R8KAA3_9BACT|nr:glycosyltransferase [Phragmitibacter flavus]TLD69253.1 glycosyltransferase [Phragmitibacter flavus]